MNRSLANPLGIDPVGGAIGGALDNLPGYHALNSALFGGGHFQKPHAAVHSGGFRNFAEPQNQSAYNAPDGMVGGSSPFQPRQMPPAGGQPGMPAQPVMGSSPFANAGATLGMTGPAASGGMQQPRSPMAPPMYRGQGPQLGMGGGKQFAPQNPVGHDIYLHDFDRPARTGGPIGAQFGGGVPAAGGMQQGGPVTMGSTHFPSPDPYGTGHTDLGRGNISYGTALLRQQRANKWG